MGIPPDDDGPLLPTSLLPVAPPQGDPTTLHGYARNYLQLAWWTKSLHEDLITTGRWALHAMSFDGVREYVERKLLNLVSEAGLHQRGYTLAAHACEQYAKRLEALKQGNAELNRQVGVYNQDLNVMVSKCAAGIPPDLHAEIAALRSSRRNLADAISAGLQLEQQAAEAAANNFLAAKFMNSRDLNSLSAAADPNLTPDQRRTMLMQAFGVAVIPMTKEQADQLLMRAGLKSAYDAFEAELAGAAGRGAAEGAVRGGTRVVAGGAGLLLGVVLDLALFPDKLADGDLDDALTGARPISDALQKQKLYDDDGNEITLPHEDEEPEPQAGGAGHGTGGPPYNCDEPNEGDDWGGPGAWRDVNRGNYQALWKRYQEQVTGVAVGHEYSHDGVDFDGFQKEQGQDVFIEAKSRFYKSALKGATVDEDGDVIVERGSMADKTLQKLLNQLQRQTDALLDQPNAKLRYVMAEDEALEKLKAYAKQNLDADNFDKIEWQHLDNDFKFDGC